MIANSIWMRTCLTVVAVAGFSAGLVAQEGLVITEFQARNDTTILLADRSSPDWLEIFNGSPNDISLEGYHLTDNAEDFTKWTFPAVTLSSGQFLVVYCSGDDIRDPDADLHTNFNLDGDGGDSVLLMAPNGQEVVSGFIRFPAQVADTSYGLSMDAEIQSLVDETSAVRVHVPTDDSLGATWTTLGFSDASWTEGTQAVGFGGASSDRELIGANIEEAMRGINQTAYVRIPFDVGTVDGIDLFTLRLRYDDGVAVYLNGERILLGNAVDPLTWNSGSDGGHSPRNWETFDLIDSVDLLRPGRNVLAVQVMNSTLSGSDLFFLAELETIDVRGVETNEVYFAEPTPGAPNRRGVDGVAPAPEFSSPGGLYTEAQTVVLATEVEGGVIRYTLDGRTPTEDSTEFTEPIEVNGTVRLTARVFHPDLLPGLTSTETFVLLDPGLANFSSNLPLVIALTFGRQVPNNCEGAYIPGHFIVIEPGEDGRTRLTETPSYSHYVGYRRRGSSTCGRQKFSFNVESWNEDNEGVDTTFFDWPAHEDYSMYGPENFDRALMRNPLAYELSNQMGQYAPRTRFVECYLHTRTGPVSQASYWGVYVLMERNKIGPGRVEIDRVSNAATQEPDVSGGYLMKIDRNDGVATVSLGGQTVVPVQPKVLTGAQRTFLVRWFTQMRASLNPDNVIVDDGQFIDVRAWIDHHIINLLPFNVDAFRLSGYLFKPRNGPVHMGPAWDYDRSMGSTDGRDINPVTWGDTGGSSFFSFGWYGTLFRNRPPTQPTTAWDREYVRRWRELRGGVLSQQNIDATIDRFADELREAADRNFTRWGGVRPRTSPPPLNGTFQGEVDHLKNWLRRRGEFIDTNFLPVPEIDPPSSLVESGAQVAITIDPGFQIFYTLDGSDPRLPNGMPSEVAIPYEGPISITESTRIVARARQGESVLWSSIVEGVYVLSIPELAVSELMYSPLAGTPEEDPQGEFRGTDMEFIEIQNIGTETADLFGVSFGRTVSFEFGVDSTVNTLAPGGVAVIVKDLAGFRARYGDEIPVAGEYGGSLSNSGENVTIVAPTGDEIQAFRYDDDWYPETDGMGFSLVHVDPSNTALDSNEATSWRQSETMNGNPGVVAGGPPPGGSVRPGDLNGDTRLNILDAIVYFLLGEPGVTLPCGDGTVDDPSNKAILDTNGDSRVDLTDALYTLNHLFQSGPPPTLGASCTRLAGCSDNCSG